MSKNGRRSRFDGPQVGPVGQIINAPALDKMAMMRAAQAEATVLKRLNASLAILQAMGHQRVIDEAAVTEAVALADHLWRHVSSTMAGSALDPKADGKPKIVSVE